MQRGERLGAGPAIGLAVCTRGLPASDFVGVVRGPGSVSARTCVFRPRQLSTSPLTSRTRPGLISHGGQRSRVKFARAVYEFKGHVSTSRAGESLGTRLLCSSAASAYARAWVC